MAYNTEIFSLKQISIFPYASNPETAPNDMLNSDVPGTYIFPLNAGKHIHITLLIISNYSITIDCKTDAKVCKCKIIGLAACNAWARAKHFGCHYHLDIKDVNMKRGYAMWNMHHSHPCMVFTTAEGMGPSATTFFKHLSARLSVRHSKCYSQVLNWIRCCISFSLLRSSITCLRGAHSSIHCPCHSFHSQSHEWALSDGSVF